MELYYKDFISAENSLDKLVDDLMLLVQGADEFARAAGATVAEGAHEEIRTRLQRLKENCAKIKGQAVAGALATDKLLHQYPYSAVGFTFALGLLVVAISRKDK